MKDLAPETFYHRQIMEIKLMIEPSPPMTPQIANVQRAIFDNIEFAKKQQWAITNYTVLIYAGLFGLAKSLDRISCPEKAGLTVLAALTLSFAIGLLIQIQRDTGRSRTRLEEIHNRWLNADERSIAGIEPYGSLPALRGVWFLIALMGVTAMGAFIVIYFLWR